MILLLLVLLALPPPLDIDAEVSRAADDVGIEPALLKGLLMNESGLNPGARGRAGNGIASFTPAGVRAVNELRGRRGHDFVRFRFRDAMDPRLAISAAAELLGHHVRRYGRDAGIAAYRCPAHANVVRRLGRRRARGLGLLRWCAGIPTSGGYIDRVLLHAQRFREGR